MISHSPQITVFFKNMMAQLQPALQVINYSDPKVQATIRALLHHINPTIPSPAVSFLYWYPMAEKSAGRETKSGGGVESRVLVDDAFLSRKGVFETFSRSRDDIRQWEGTLTLYSRLTVQHFTPPLSPALGSRLPGGKRSANSSRILSVSCCCCKSGIVISSSPTRGIITNKSLWVCVRAGLCVCSGVICDVI